MHMHEYADFAHNVAHDAANIARMYFRAEHGAVRKQDETPVTLADTEINALLIERVRATFPEHAVQGEEACLVNPAARYVWVCDPIDGTIPFSCGVPTFAFSLALVDRKDGLPRVAVIHDVANDMLYSAVRGEGVGCNGESVSVSAVERLCGAYVDVEARAYGEEYENLRTMQALQEQDVFCFKMQSVVYGGLQVAHGALAGVIFFNPYAHDVAALKLIVEEAGGKVTDLEGNERRYDAEGKGAVISNGLVHEQLLACVQ